MARSVWISTVAVGGEEEARVRRRTEADCDRLVEMVREERRPRQSPQIAVGSQKVPKFRRSATRRTPKTSRVPRTRAGGEWTEAAFFQFLRSGLRQMSRRWPPLVRHVWLASRRPSLSTNRRLKWEFRCASCGLWYKRDDMQADHIIPCGSLRSWDDLSVFAERLFCEAAGLRIYCADCHQARHGKGEPID